MDILGFLRLLESSVEARPGSLTLDDRLDEIGWDSVAHLSLIAETDRVGALVIDSSRMGDAETVRDLYEAISVE